MTPETDYDTRSHLPPGQYQGHFASRDPGRDLMDYMRSYARERPEVAALWCLGIGFVLGWKLKPW